MVGAITSLSSPSHWKVFQSLSYFKAIPDLFTDIFPFHLVFDRNHKILQIGEVLQRIYPELTVGSQLEQHFQINRPNIQVEFAQIRKRTRSLFLLDTTWQVTQKGKRYTTWQVTQKGKR